MHLMWNYVQSDLEIGTRLSLQRDDAIDAVQNDLNLPFLRVDFQGELQLSTDVCKSRD